MKHNNQTATLLRSLYKLVRVVPEQCDNERHTYIKDMIENSVKAANNEIDLPGIVASLTLQLEINDKVVLEFMDMYTSRDSELLALLQKHRASRIKGGITCAAERRAERSVDWDIWQAHAIEIWRHNPKLSKADVARRIAERRGLGENIDTIRKRINKKG